MGKNDIQILKKGYSRDRFTSSQYEELARCMIDPIYFIEKYMLIQHAMHGRVPFKMYPFQHKMVRAMHENRFTVLLTARQSGKTTCAAGYLLWKAMFCQDSTILIAANVHIAAYEIMEKIRFAYENLEQYNWLRAGITEYNKGSISFDNGSRIISRATTPSAGRGLAITCLSAKNTNVTVRDKLTGEIRKLTINELIELEQQNQSINTEESGQPDSLKI
jgi:phage terminase large subunit-like protein